MRQGPIVQRMTHAHLYIKENILNRKSRDVHQSEIETALQNK